MFIIYEVNLKIEPQIKQLFLSWLNEHIEAMLRITGFQTATVYTDMDQDDMVVHYHISDQKCLEDYFKLHAQKMREDGLNRFGTQFSATRRVLQPITANAKNETGI